MTTTSLVSLLEEKSRERGLLSGGEPLTAERAFALVRDMPYRRASSRRPEAIVEEWQGTCSGKHYLLADIFRELGLETRVFMATHRFTAENTGHFPAELRELVAHGPVPDVHTYLRVSTPRAGRWWTPPGPAAPPRWGCRSTASSAPAPTWPSPAIPSSRCRCPPGEDPQQFKEQVIARFCGQSSQTRDDFIEGLGRWLGDST